MVEGCVQKSGREPEEGEGLQESTEAQGIETVDLFIAGGGIGGSGAAKFAVMGGPPRSSSSSLPCSSFPAWRAGTGISCWARNPRS